MENLDYANYVITSITEVNFFEKKPELRQLRQLRITEAIFLKKNLNYVNYVITPITQLQKRQNHPLVLPLVPNCLQCQIVLVIHNVLTKFYVVFENLCLAGSPLQIFSSSEN